MFSEQFPGLQNILRTGDKRHGDKIGVDIGQAVDIGKILGGQGRGCQTPSQAIDALAGSELTAYQNRAIDGRSVDIVHPQADATIVQQQGVAPVTLLHSAG